MNSPRASENTRLSARWAAWRFAPETSRPGHYTPRHLPAVAAIAALAAFGATALLAGCGSGGGSAATSAATGRASLTIVWPARSATSKLIPAASNSIVASFLQDATVVATQTVARPADGTTSTVSFDSLPPGNLNVTASAYPNADGTGVAQASATLNVPIVSGKITGVDIDMATTIDHLSITPFAPTVTIGKTLAASVTPYDVGNRVVLVTPTNISWTSLTPAVVTVDPASGLLTGVALGTGQIQVTDSESGKVGTATVTVVPPVAITISPTAVTVGVDLSTTFTATVVGPTNTAVTWSVQEGTAGGTITSAGVYTAPANSGTYHVVATSVVDTTKSATATVTVTSGTSTVTIN